MPRPATKPKRILRHWTKEDYTLLRKLAKEGATGAAIAKRLKRTKAAVYQRAALKGISFGSRSSPRKRK